MVLSPRTPDSSAEAQRADLRPGVTPVVPLRVLIVEDDADTRENLRDLLDLDGYQAATAGTIADVLSRPDLAGFGAIILDRRLPDGTAEELLPCLKLRAPAASVIVVTGHADLEGAIAAIHHGAADYVLKPVNPDSLRTRLATLTQNRRFALEKEQAEEALRKEKALVESLIETAPAIVLVLDPQGRITRFNAYMEELSGYPLCEVQGQDWFDTFLPGSARARSQSVFKQTLTGSYTGGIISPILTRDGRSRQIEWASRTLTDPLGLPTLVLCIGHDITDLQQAQERALQAERLAAIGEMMTGLTHESRNALQRSKACLEMLELEVSDRPSALDLVQRLIKAQEHLERLYEEVRSYAAPIRLNREPCDLPHLWREVWSHLAPLHSDKHVKFRETCETCDCQCLVDRFSLGQVFRNILENAVSVVPIHGEITVSCAESTLAGTPALEIVFGDNGPGLDAEQQKRIFEPFYTTKAKGTGLGMAIAKRIIESHGGQLSVRDRTLPGAEIVIVLPREKHD